MVPVHVLVATGVNADGHREILGVQVTTSEDGAGWLGFFRDLTARGLSGVKLVTSDAHAGLVAATAATIPGAAVVLLVVLCIAASGRLLAGRQHWVRVAACGGAALVGLGWTASLVAA